MKTRVWILALLVIAALLANLGLLSPRVAVTAEEAMTRRRTAATNGLRAQIDLIDARLNPRVIAAAPELIDLLKAPADVTQPMPKPDERAIKTALGAAPTEPDFIAVGSTQGAVVQRKGKGPAQMVPAAQAASVPLLRPILEGARPKPTFAAIDGALYRVSGAMLPQSSGAVVVGAVVDDALAARLRSLIEADVTFFDGGKLVASSAPPPLKALLQEWVKQPGPGVGTLPVRLNIFGLGMDFTGKLPLWADRHAHRAALLPLEGTVQAAVSVNAADQLGWLGRYQALYLMALLGLLVFSVLWGLAPVKADRAAAKAEPTRAEPRPRVEARAREARATPPPAPLADPEFTPAESKPAPPAAVPWAHADEAAGWHHLGESRPRPDLKAEARAEAEAPPAPPPPAPIDEPELPAVQAAANEAAGSDAPPAEAARPEEPAAAPDMWGATKDEAPAPAADAWGAPEAAPPAEAWPESPAEAWPEGSPLHDGSQAAKHEPLDPPMPPPPAAAAEVFPGDEPTRIEPVSAALIDKMREPEPAPPAEAVAENTDRFAQHEPDQDAAPPAAEGTGWPEGGISHEASPHPLRETAPEQPHDTLRQPRPDPPATNGPQAASTDPDEAHWRDTFQKFIEVRAQTGEPAERLSYDKFAAKLRKNREDLLARHQCRGVRFQVYVKEGKAAIKASAIK